MTDSAITRFNGRYVFLSNFSYDPVWLDGVRYATVEHAYQAAKTCKLHERAPFQHPLTTPAAAKRMGRHLNMREDWESIKLDVMESLLRRKFLNPTLCEKLLATGKAELVEGNTWGDVYWGQCPVGNGANHLGRLLMKIRDGE